MTSSQSNFEVHEWVEVQNINNTDIWLPAQIIQIKNNDQYIIVYNNDNYHNQEVINKDRIRKLGSNLDLSPKEILNQQQKELIKKLIKEKLNGKLVDIGADGNCLYRAFAEFLYGQQDLYPNVRKQCHQQLIQDREKYISFLTTLRWIFVLAYITQIQEN